MATFEGDGILSLGGNIELTGFGSFEGAEMVVVKKIVGNYARRFSGLCQNFEKLHIVAKAAKEREKSELFEVSATVLDNGKKFDGSGTGRNLYFVLGEALKRIEKQLEAHKEKAKVL